MPLGTTIAVYIVVWWICLFAVLPWGARSQRDAGHIFPGSDPGAPAVFRFLPTLLATSVIAAAVTAGLLWLLGSSFLRDYLR